MKVINLDPTDSVFIIEDQGRHYLLTRTKITNTSEITLVLSELDEDDLTHKMLNCKLKS